MASLSADKKVEIVSDLFRESGAEVADDFSVVAPGKIRIHPKEAT